MKYPPNIRRAIESANATLTEMIAKAREQRAKNFDMLFTLEKGLNELLKISESEQPIDLIFMNNWDSVMGWAPRVFEGHPLLDLLVEIDNFLVNSK